MCVRIKHDQVAPRALTLVKDRLGGVKTPKQIEVWPDLPRSKVGKILKSEVRSRLLGATRSSR
jgi:acyl-coenzyme A synthetase/AMP-(fatty) acid ligase